MDDETSGVMAVKIAKICAARKRYAQQTGKLANDLDVIAFLCDEIEYYRNKIKQHKEVTTEQAADGGVMTLSRKTASWKLVAECLLTNGYFVCCHIDDENDGETITIEYWRA